jgi:hypothetical protein
MRLPVGDPVSEAAITGAALVRHLDDARFASLRALRQLLRALDAERIAIGFLSPDGSSLQEELVWAQGLWPLRRIGAGCPARHSR